jgi:hypothetical protein
MPTWTSLTLRLVAHAAVRPRVAWDLLTLVWAFRRRRWYLRPPFLPLPPAEYIAWRLYTVYGEEHAVPPVQDVLRFARWRRHITRA